MKPFVLVCAASIALCSGGASAATVYVDLNGGGDYLTIQEGLDAVASGDTVLVAPGTYTGPENRDLSFAGKSIVLAPAFARDPVIIDCEGLDRAFTFVSGESAAAVVDGIKFMNGSASAGGGIHCVASSPTIRNCAISECVAVAGGGVNCDDNAYPTFISCTIKQNAADNAGGGFRCSGYSAPVLTDVVIIDNTSYYGGGMMTRGGSFPTLTNVVFDGNVAEWSGGLRCEAGGAVLENVLFIRNHAWYSGGGMGSGQRAWPHLTNCTFLDNSADTRGGGYANGTRATLTNCTFAANAAALGGGLFSGPPYGHAELTNCIIAFSGIGPAVYCQEPEGVPTITHSCIFGNAGGDDLCGDFYENLYEDPLFCGLPAGDVTLHEASPCVPANNPWGELIGAHGIGCTGPVAVETMTWGAIKGLYR